MRRLLKHPAEMGGRLSWGKGLTPGVGGWYPIGGSPSAVWILNANSESPTTFAYLSFSLNDIAAKHGPRVVEDLAHHLGRIPALRAKMEQARDAGWSKWPSVRLVDLTSAPENEEALFDALRSLSGEPSPDDS